ncbi:C-C chemokine receptor type 1-like isoform X1 [Mytilus edulis]
MAYKFPDFDYIEADKMEYNISDISDQIGFSLPSTVTPPTANISFVNPSQYYSKYIPEKTIVGRYVTLLTYSIGFPGNIFALCIWLQKRMSNSSGYYLAALALSDLLFLTLQVFHELNDTWEISTLDVKFLCEFYPIIFMTSQYLSPLLVLAFTVERYISICHPFKRERFCTTTRAMIVIVCLAIFCLCMNLIQGYFWSYNSQFAKCLPRPSAIKNGDKSLWSVWTWFSETVVFMLVPLLILFFNVLVINEARRLSKFEKHQLKSHAKSHGNATTVMLIAVSFYHIFTTFPVTIAVALYVQYSVEPEDSLSLVNSTMPYLSDNSTHNLVDASALTHQWSSHFRYILVKSIIEEIGLTHYAFNFYIYLITGKIFREEFLSFVRRIICRKEKKHIPSWNTEYTNVRTDPESSNHLTVRMINGQPNGHSGNDKIVDDSETPL